MSEVQADKPQARVVAYITSWCPDCIRSRRVFQRMAIPCIEIDIEQVSGAEAEMRAINGGSGKVPTIVIDNGGANTILIEPGDAELIAALRAACL